MIWSITRQDRVSDASEDQADPARLSTPKPFEISEIGKCIAYDGHVVDSWLSHLRQYTQDDSFLVGKSILELGPGSDLGIGILLLSQGASRYNACDVNNLVTSVPDKFYESIFDTLNNRNDRVSVDFLKAQLERLKCGRPSQLNYVVRDNFDLASAFEKDSIELVFSQAAFEHFDDVDATVSQLSNVCKSGAVIVSVIDLQTHSRWIRDKDPNNIYRYAESIYNAFRFRGTLEPSSAL